MNIKIDTSIKTEVLEITDNDTGQSKYYVDINNEWIQISEEKYDKILNGDKVE